MAKSSGSIFVTYVTEVEHERSCFGANFDDMIYEPWTISYRSK